MDSRTGSPSRKRLATIGFLLAIGFATTLLARENRPPNFVVVFVDDLGYSDIPAGTSSSEVTATIDLLPTFAKLAGCELAADRVIDGHDIGPILRGEPSAKSPHGAFYYYQMDQLQAVRSGKWKLFVAMESKKRNWGKPEGEQALKLFDLAADIHEDRNLAESNPEVVKRLRALAEEARVELGDVDRPGKGQRTAGWVDKPMPRLKESN